MNNPEIFNQNILNQITSEIVVLDKDLKLFGLMIQQLQITGKYQTTIQI